MTCTVELASLYVCKSKNGESSPITVSDVANAIELYRKEEDGKWFLTLCALMGFIFLAYCLVRWIWKGLKNLVSIIVQQQRKVGKKFTFIGAVTGGATLSDTGHETVAQHIIKPLENLYKAPSSNEATFNELKSTNESGTTDTCSLGVADSSKKAMPILNKANSVEDTNKILNNILKNLEDVNFNELVKKNNYNHSNNTPETVEKKNISGIIYSDLGESAFNKPNVFLVGNITIEGCKNVLVHGDQHFYKKPKDSTQVRKVD